MTCKKHPRYEGFKPPKVNCEGCWIQYLGMCETCVNCGCQEIEFEEPELDEDEDDA